MTTPDQATYFRKGFGLKTEVQETLSADYTGRLVDLLRARDFTLQPAPRQSALIVSKRFEKLFLSFRQG